jgi:hypothetical protein
VVVPLQECSLAEAADAAPDTAELQNPSDGTLGTIGADLSKVALEKVYLYSLLTGDSGSLLEPC